jgi:hypothetical protein
MALQLYRESAALGNDAAANEAKRLCAALGAECPK